MNLAVDALVMLAAVLFIAATFVFSGTPLGAQPRANRARNP